jgi:hypothetical protein
MDGRAPSPHDLVPLDLATASIFRRVYEERMQVGVPGRPGAHLDGLAYTVAEITRIYVYGGDGAARPLSAPELAGGLFQDGARTLAFIDGRPPISNLAVRATDVPALIDVLNAAANSGHDG